MTAYSLLIMLLTLASYTLQIRLHSYSNPGSQDLAGENCDDDTLCGIFDSGCERCDTYFTFCLRNAGGTRSTDSEICNFGGPLTTDFYDDSDEIDFSTRADLGNSVPNPVVFTGEDGDRWPGSFLLFVEVADDDIFPNPDDTVANIFVERELAPSSSFTPPEFFTAANARLELSFRVQCNSGFTGPDCTPEPPPVPTPVPPPTEDVDTISGGIGSMGGSDGARSHSYQILTLLVGVVAAMIAMFCIIMQ